MKTTEMKTTEVKCGDCYMHIPQTKDEGVCILNGLTIKNQDPICSDFTR